MAIEFARSQLNYHDMRCWAAIRNPRQTDQHYWEAALLSIWNDLPQEFIDKAILSFGNVLLQLIDTLKIQLNTERTADIHLETFEPLTKSCAKFDSLLLNIQDATACSLEWTLNFKLLYLLNHIYCFNKICRMCGLNPHL